MLLVIDVGNTTTVVGIFDCENGENDHHSTNKLIAHWRLSSILHTPDELGIYILTLLSTKNIKPEEIHGAAFASVVPPLDFSIREAIKKFFNVNPLEVNGLTDIGMEIRYVAKREVGADRVVNAVAGREKYGAPLIVADYGTAITFDVVSPDGAYIGGAIAPGLNSAISALFSNTAQLPKVALDIPSSVIGHNTNDAIQSGILIGNAGLTDHIIDLIREELKFPDTKVVATGGHASLMAKVSKNIDYVDPWLMLEGLRFIYNRINNK